MKQHSEQNVKIDFWYPGLISLFIPPLQQSKQMTLFLFTVTKKPITFLSFKAYLTILENKCFLQFLHTKITFSQKKYELKEMLKVFETYDLK